MGKKGTSLQNYRQGGSAFILVVVLTTLLMLIGMMFLLSTRVDKMSTSAVFDKKEMDDAVSMIVEKISQDLFQDMNNLKYDNFYDYPDVNNFWLASLEPEPNGTMYQWQQISDVTGFLHRGNYNTQYVSVDPPTNQQVIREYPEQIVFNDNSKYFWADADGDGIADSKWIQLNEIINTVPYNILTSKNQPIFAAVRVVDNGGMLNVNTDYQFAPTLKEKYQIDGSSQMQINLAALAKLPDNINQIQMERRGGQPWTESEPNREDFGQKMIWPINGDLPAVGSAYQPYDIADELELRNRFCIDYAGLAKLESTWSTTLLGTTHPFDGSSDCNLSDWKLLFNTNIERRHLLTTYNLDRIIDRFGKKMVNVNKETSLENLYGAVSVALSDACVPSPGALASQIAVNLRDCVDSNTEEKISSYSGKVGFERPCIFISELVHSYSIDTKNTVYHSFAVEVSKHFPAKNGDEWILNILDKAGKQIISVPLPQDFADDSSRYFVALSQDSLAPLSVDFNDTPINGEQNIDPDIVLTWKPYDLSTADYDFYIGTIESNVESSKVRDPNIGVSPGVLCNKGQLQNRYPLMGGDWSPVTGNPSLSTGVTYYWRVDDVDIGGNVIFKGPVWSFTVGNPKVNRVSTFSVNVDTLVGGSIQLMRGAILVDSVPMPADINQVNHGTASTVSYQREMSEIKFIKRLWTGSLVGISTLGHNNWQAEAAFAGVLPLQVFFGPLNNIGELGKVFAIDMYNIPFQSAALEDKNVRIDLTAPAYQYLFNYLTVMDPADHGQSGETRIKGRININTAPWYVISQLPWATQSLAQEIVNARETIKGYKTIGKLMNIPEMQYYQTNPPNGYPDLTFNPRTQNDGVLGDFEKRDLIFARISDLVTVRSDVFTAYILVRLGQNGPQKRMIAIFDRSDVRPDPANAGKILGKVKIRALYEVPDAR